MKPDLSHRAAWNDADFARAARRAWRIALVAYLVPISVATHWPRLGFTGGGTIDKFIHFAGFGVLAWLFMNAKPFGRAWLGWCIAAGWVYLDERTQAIEILGRTFSTLDMLAGWIGVVLAGALYAIRAARTPPGSDARSDAVFASDLAYSSGFAWRSAALVTLVVIVVVGGGIVAKESIWGEGVYFATFVYATGYAGLLGLVLAAIGVDMFGAAHGARHRGRALVQAPRAALPFWRLGFTVGGAALVIVGFDVLVQMVFGTDPPEDLRVDFDGFTVLRQGILIAAIPIGIALGNTVGARAAYGANPALASRR